MLEEYRRKNRSKPPSPSADGWIIFMKVNILWCNFNGDWSLRALCEAGMCIRFTLRYGTWLMMSLMMA